MFEDLRDREIDLCVLSNWDARLHAVLDGSGLGEYLSKRFISAELGWEKPDPAIYRHVSEILRLPSNTLLSVGDDPKNDVEGPKRAGWQAVQIERPKRDLWAAVRAIHQKVAVALRATGFTPRFHSRTALLISSRMPCPSGAYICRGVDATDVNH